MGKLAAYGVWVQNPDNKIKTVIALKCTNFEGLCKGRSRSLYCGGRGQRQDADATGSVADAEGSNFEDAPQPRQ